MYPKKRNWVWAAIVIGAVLALFFMVKSKRFSNIENRSVSEVPVLLGAQQSAFLATIPKSESFNPKTGEDFLVFLWVRFSKYPTKGARAIVALKYDEKSSDREGFGLALVRGRAGVRPEVYWKGGSRIGGWYPFPDVEIKLHRWYLFAVSFRGDRFLGFHTVAHSLKSPETVLTLGGHEVTGLPLPESGAPLAIGKNGSLSSFRGDIGPTGIVAGHNLSDHLQHILGELSQHPTVILQLPSSLRMVNWTVDRSGISLEPLSIKKLTEPNKGLPARVKIDKR
jgi:hypothetical protein